MRKVKINSGSRILSGTLSTKNYSQPGIIIAHSFRNNQNEAVCRDAFEYFAKNGYNTFSFDFTGHGESEGDISDLSYQTITQDITAVKEFLDCHSTGLGAFGISLGSFATALSPVVFRAQTLLSPSPLLKPDQMYLRYKDQISKKTRVLNKNGYIELNSASGRGKFRMGQDWINEMKVMKSNLLEKYCSKTTPTLIIDGTKDDLTDISELKKTAKNKLNCELVIIPNADHNFTTPTHRKRVISLSRRFFDKYFKR